MDGENNGKPYFLMDDLGGKLTIFGNIHINHQVFRTELREKLMVRSKESMFFFYTSGWKDFSLPGISRGP